MDGCFIGEIITFYDDVDVWKFDSLCLYIGTVSYDVTHACFDRFMQENS